MSDGTIEVTSGTGTKLDTEVLSVAGIAQKHRQRIQIAGTNESEIAAVSNSDAAGGYALSVRVAGTASGAADTGYPVKIGGKANAAPPAVVDESDRVNAWFSLNGQQTVINTHEPATVYDTGRRAVEVAQVIGVVIAASSVAVIPAMPGMRTKVLGLGLQVVAYTSIGSLGLSGSGVSSWIFQVTAPGIGQFVNLSQGPYIQYATAVNTALSLQYTGTCTFNGFIIFYQAP